MAQMEQSRIDASEKYKPWRALTVIGILALSAVAGAFIIILWIFPKWFTGSSWLGATFDFAQPTNPAQRIELLGTQLQASIGIIQLIGALVVGLGLFTGYQNIIQSQKQLDLTRQQIEENRKQAEASLQISREQLDAARDDLEQNRRQGEASLVIAREQQITDRFTKAIEQLGAIDHNGEPALEVRLGAIYALERIAQDSERDYWPIIEVLTAYVRQHAPAPEAEVGAGPKRYRSAEFSPPRIDIQTILTILGRRTEQQCQLDGNRRLDLSETNMRRVNLNDALLKEANLSLAQLQGAALNYSNLSGVNLFLSQMHGSEFYCANLEGANLNLANLKGAYLERANLKDADFEDANLESANLTGANLDGANLRGANLTSSLGLTQQQIDQSYMDRRTTPKVIVGSNGEPLRHSNRVWKDPSEDSEIPEVEPWV